MLDSLRAEGSPVIGEEEHPQLTPVGETLVCDNGIDLAGLKAQRRPLCRACLDWSERRIHLSGSLGKALLSHFLDRGYARREPGSRAIVFSPEGERRFAAMFPDIP